LNFINFDQSHKIQYFSFKNPGYFIEVKFASDSGLAFEYQFSTPGYVWPNTLPFKDCSGVTC